ncbi:MAG: hypothetical protein HND51_23915 [Chloroflexi bacterium]|nr:hypothetical protein [Chloroflexota bacterium]NOH14696.1 hypothetical protein [Chloroflexota bacterium]
MTTHPDHLPLIKTKLMPPRPRAKGLSRLDLVHKLNAGVQGKLTTLTAPAGFGKSSLLAEWIQESAWPVCWLSLDEHDNSAGIFLNYLISGLQGYKENIGASLLETLDAPEPPNPQMIVRLLVNDLAELQEDIVVVLDDFHLIDNPVLLDAIDFLIEHAPPQAHFCISSRAQLPFESAKRRANNQLAEFGVQHLRFSEQECEHFLRDTMRLDLGQAEVQRLYEQTEGWPAGLQLAALARQTETVPSNLSEQDEYLEAYSGEQSHIFEYLAAEVLEQEPVEIQDFLLASSILDQFNVALCEAVTENQRAGEIISELSQRNLFLVALDQEGHWFRYHHLFRDFLLEQLEAHPPEQNATLHARASRWYFENGSLEQGIEHGLAAGNFDGVATEIQKHADTMWTFQETVTLRHWLDQLPEETLGDYPHLQLFDAWTSIMTGKLPEAVQALTKAEATIQVDPKRWGDLIGVLSTVRATLLIQQSDPQALKLYQHAYDTLPNEAENWLGAVHLGLGMALSFGKQTAGAIQWLASGVELNLQIGNMWAAMYALFFLGQAHLAQGDLQAAEAIYRRGLQLTSQGRAQPSLLSVWAHLGLAEVATLRQDFEQASEHAITAIRLGKQRDSHENVVRGSLLLAQVEAANGRREAVEELMEQAEEYAQRPGIPDMRPLVQHKKAEIISQINANEQQADSNSGQALIEPLSETEVALLELLSQGQSNEGIAAARFISINTVKWHLKNIYGKLGVKNRTTAVAEARQLGLIS